MPLPDFAHNKPVSHPDSAGDTINFIRDNFEALFDYQITGSPDGVSYARDIGNGTAVRPQYHIYEKQVEGQTARWIATITYGTTGGATGKPVTVLWQYRPNPGAAYETRRTVTIVYDASGYVSSVTSA